MVRTPRPYIKSSQQLDLHAAENVGEEAEKVLLDLAQFLSDRGFERSDTKKGRKRNDKKEKDQMAITAKKEEATISESNPTGVQSSSGGVIDNRAKYGVIGLRSVLKLINAEKSSSLAAILFDSGMLKPAAVAHLVALAALGMTDTCPFYAIPDLSNAFSKRLNLPKVSAIGLTTESMNALPAISTTFHQIGLSLKIKQQATGVASSFATPSLQVPKGKSSARKTNNKKKKKGKNTFGNKR